MGVQSNASLQELLGEPIYLGETTFSQKSAQLVTVVYRVRGSKKNAVVRAEGEIKETHVAIEKAIATLPDNSTIDLIRPPEDVSSTPIDQTDSDIE